MRGRLVALAAVAMVRVATAQGPIRGTVSDGAGRPVAEARVTANKAGVTFPVDRAGRFEALIRVYPETLVTRAVGFRPDTLAVPTAPTGPIAIVLVRLTLLEELGVVARREAQVAVPGRSGEWSLGQRAIRAAPAAIETDVFRSLSIVPAVSFSSILSARPIIRGYEPNQAPTRVDGFELPNLYRLGRLLSSFPADATERVTVGAAPGNDPGGGLAGQIDIEGRRGRDESFGGGGLSLGSLGAYAGGRPAGIDGFGAVRFLHLASALGALNRSKVPATFLDGYARFDLGHRVGRRASVSALYSSDRYGNLEDQDDLARWHTLLLGGRAEVIGDSLGSIEVAGSFSRFRQEVVRGPTLRTEIDVDTRLDLARIGVDARRRLGAFELRGGGSLSGRSVVNTVGPTRLVRPFEPWRPFDDYTFDQGYTEQSAHASVQWNTGTAWATAGVAGERGPWDSAIAPRLGLGMTFGSSGRAEAAFGRRSALHHFISDAASEPSLAYYDYWLPAGVSGAPRPTVDHASLDVRFHRGIATFRATGYFSAGRGLMAVRPPTDQRRADLFRAGRSRTAGLELQITLSPDDRPDRVASLIYVTSRSERNWGNGWVPWSLDRRHVARLQLASTIAKRWRVDLLADATSGPPYTPAVGLVPSGVLDGVPRGYPRPFIFGAENTARDIARLRTDIGFTHHFNGPRGSRLFWGISVLNLTWGPVLPLFPRDDIPIEPDGSPLGYERFGRVPFLPTFTLRAEF